ncbi:bifunctional UDP-sugar hydrolase/5'-nucleotidase [Vitiosangium sp. GDMCC 1.1324]|uniref:bifunctional metallophosphatase/5'-nucleotidase n=1 Tax=Vitiosangium sp. (strain GDMCC 1.1324) TaxID=2138576 RepID=UPI000D3B674B|nr:5'-nucleotidase C-terminal domain-containing protein [Vitiosangium sp. GDMCC 1.1324]PTL75346.1 bifunctional metallophosphatase/5'-nucleotidase [Vitiosangium sp. GDMCC 1.1324]
MSHPSRLLSPLASSLAALLLAGCATLPGSASAPESPPAANAASDSTQDDEPSVTLTLLHVNDVYQFSPVDFGARGGLARLSTLRKRVLAESPNTLFLLAGDTLGPSVESTFHKGKQMIDAWNALGLDVAVLGNHEFDFGPDVMRQRMKESHFTWLGANVMDKQTGHTFGDTPPFIIRDVGGVKVGIFGVLLGKTKYSSKPGPDVYFTDTCARARELVPQMRKQGAQVVVALTHLFVAEDKVLARCAPIDLIIGGHEHVMMQAVSNGTPIIKMSSEARELGRVTLHVGTQSHKLKSMDFDVLPVTPEVPEDPAFATAMHEYDAMMADLSQPVGRTAVALDAIEESNRTHETNLASFVADAYRKATGAEVALINGGSIRSDSVLRPGPLTRRDVLAIHPYPGSVVSIEVTGEALRQALEHGVSRSAEEAGPGRFPQVSGIQYAFDVCRPVGDRIVRATVNGEPLDPKRTYTLATNSYMSGGGDGYTMFKGAKYRVSPEKGKTTQDVLRDAFASAESIAPVTSGRIERLRGGVRDTAKKDDKDVPACPAHAAAQ